MKKLNLIEKMKNYSGFFNEKRPVDYIKIVKSELSELRKELHKKSKKGIEDELGDVLFQTIMLYEKIATQYNVSIPQMYKNVVNKYKTRAPHIFNKKYIGLHAEDEAWFKWKKENDNKRK